MARFVHPIALGLALVGGLFWLFATWGLWLRGGEVEAVWLVVPLLVLPAVLTIAQALRRRGRPWASSGLLALIALPTVLVIGLLDTFATAAVVHAHRDFLPALAGGSPIAWSVIGGVFALLLASSIALWRRDRREAALVVLSVAAGLLLLLYGLLGIAFAFRFAR